MSLSNLTPDDLEKRMLVTIHSYVKRTIEHYDDLDPNIQAMLRMGETQPSRQFMGIPIEILDINIPYICVKVYSPQCIGGLITVIDTREVRLMKITEDFAQNVMGKIAYERFLAFDAVSGFPPAILEQMQTERLKQQLLGGAMPLDKFINQVKQNSQQFNPEPIKAKKRKKNDNGETKKQTD